MPLLTLWPKSRNDLSHIEPTFTSMELVYYFQYNQLINTLLGLQILCSCHAFYFPSAAKLVIATGTKVLIPQIPFSLTNSSVCTPVSIFFVLMTRSER